MRPVSRFIPFEIWVIHFAKKFVFNNIKAVCLHIQLLMKKALRTTTKGLTYNPTTYIPHIGQRPYLQPNHLYTAYWSAVYLLIYIVTDSPAPVNQNLGTLSTPFYAIILVKTLGNETYHERYTAKAKNLPLA